MEYYIDNGEEKRSFLINRSYFAVKKNGYYGIIRSVDNAIIVPFKYNCFDMGDVFSQELGEFIFAGRHTFNNTPSKGSFTQLFGRRNFFWQSGVYDKYDWDGNLIETGIEYNNTYPEDNWYGIQDYSERDMLNEFLDSSPGALGNIDW